MPSVQRRVSPNGKVSYRAMVRLKGHKPKTATFLKRADAIAWGQETEIKIKQNKYFPDRIIESGKMPLQKYLTDLLKSCNPGLPYKFISSLIPVFAHVRLKTYTCSPLML